MKQCIFILIFFLIIPVLGYARVYKCIDQDGNIIYTDSAGPNCTPALDASEEFTEETMPQKIPDNQHTTKAGYVACFKKEWLKHMSQFSVSNDKASFEAYITSQKCFIMKGGLPVTIIDYPGIFGTTVGIIYHGTQLWTVMEAIK